jgi:hypothetical protein
MNRVRIIRGKGQHKSRVYKNCLQMDNHRVGSGACMLCEYHICIKNDKVHCSCPVPIISVKLVTRTVKCETRKLKTTWTQEMSDDFDDTD